MFNPNQPNVWPFAQLSQPMAYNGNNVNPIGINSSVLLQSLQNQQNVNHLMPYYNPNEGFGQRLANQYNHNNNHYYNQSLPQPSNQAIGSSYLSQPNPSFGSNPLPQTYSSTHQKPIQSLATNQTAVNVSQSLSQPNVNDVNEDKQWLDMLNPTQKQVLDQLNKEQEVFECQFKNWEKDFENWKQVNRLHPDITAYQLYVNQWQEWRQRLVDRQLQMKDLRNRTLQQLYSQVKQQFKPIPIQSNPPPPPPETGQPPPPPPTPPKDNRLPPPPLDQNCSANESPPKTTSFLDPKNILEITKNWNKNENQLNVNLEEFRHKSDEQNDDSNDSIKIINSNKSDNNIEVIEIDCDLKKSNETKIESKSVDTNSEDISKAAETILFIQKQQELLKSLENLKKVNPNVSSSSDEIQEIESNKPFDIKDIVTKMKAIRPPENPNDANRLISELPSLQGIVFNKKPDFGNNYNNNRQQNNLSNQSLRGPPIRDSYQRFADNNPNPLALPDYRMQGIRHRLPFNSMPNRPQRPQFPIQTNNSRPPVRPHLADNNNNNNNNPNIPQFNRLGENQFNDPETDIHRERDHFYRSDTGPAQQSSSTTRTYSAQTIDYNHSRNKNKDLNMRVEPSVDPKPQFIPKPIETFANNFHFNNEINRNFNIQSENSGEYESRKAYNSPQTLNPVIEETITYRDLRYFTQPKSRVIHINDLLKPPTREFRPQNIVIILRGLPGSGKTYIAKLIKEKEVEFGGSAPRVLSIDDYFMAEVERQTKDPDSGKTVKTKEFVYEYEYEMESCYRASLLKTYKKTIDDRLFPFIIIDAVNELVGDIEDFYSYGIKNAFVVYVIEIETNDPFVCHKNNIHKRKLEDIKQIHNKWQTLPEFMLRLDIRSLLQTVSIKNIEMELNDNKSNESTKRKSESEMSETEVSKKQSKSTLDSENQSFNTQSSLSRWERMEASEAKLAKLDSFKMKTKQTIDEYLQVTDDYEQRGKDQHKRVRWADIEEKKKQEHMRKIGFVVGLDWNQYMDPEHCERALTKTKYF